MPFSLYHKIVLQLSLIASNKYFWWVALVILVFPFLLLAFFNQPSADDYCYVVMAMKSGYWQAQYDSYMTWSGRYVATFFLVSNPLLSGSFIGYQVMSSLLLILTVLSCASFVKVLLVKNRIDRSVIAVSFLFLFLYLIKMPTSVEGFFWLAGAITYQLANIAFLTLVTLLIKIEQPKRNNWKWLGAVLLCIVICGSNETSMLELLYFLVALMIFEYAYANRIPKHYYLLLVVSLLAAFVVLLAPGNAIRASYFTGNKEIVQSLISAVSASFFLLQHWLQDVLILLVLFIPFLKQIEVNRAVTRPILLGYPLFIFGILVIGYFPAFWSMGGVPPARAMNVVYFLFIASCLHYAVLCISYGKQRNYSFTLVPTYVQCILAFIFIVHTAPVNHFRTAVMDLVTGRALAYDREMKARYRYLYQNKGKDVVLQPLHVKPKSVFFTDIEPHHREYWKNVCMADYFYIKSLNMTGSAE